MERVFDYSIPILHPLLVHFPIVLLALASLACLVWARRGTVVWRDQVLLLLLLAIAATVAAHVSGDAAQVQAEGVPIVEELVGHHHLMSKLTMIVTGLSLLSMLWVRFVYKRSGDKGAVSPGIRIGVLALVGLAFVLVAYTSHVGGTMVWGVVR